MARPRKKDMEPADILHLLRKKRLSYADLDRKFGLSRGSALHASRKPHEPGEQALSDVLGMPAHRIWPSRYDPQTGERLKPQPAANNKPKRSLRHRQKASTCGQNAEGEAA
ncbi:transcriptional regulator [uncultured Cohaesibacter sp.]|uniref:helix-turn-helix domain-containing protein n=1 Tax=uncultured Cohaesibacter sp. TaxID=1002546 RepID=UPI00374A1161